MTKRRAAYLGGVAWFLDFLGPWLPSIGFLGAMALWFYVLLEGDWLSRPNPGDLPHRWGRIAWDVRVAGRLRWAWFMSALIASLLYLLMLGLHGGLVPAP